MHALIRVTPPRHSGPAGHSQLPRAERGTTLLIVLIMLVMITMFVVSMIQLSSTNASVVGNMQAQKVVETEASQAIEISLNTYNFFSDAINNQGAWSSASTTSIPFSTLWSTYTPTGAGSTAPTMLSNLTVARPQCIHTTTATGYSALSNVSPQDTTWNVQVTAEDTVTGAVTEINQGITMRLPAGSC